LYEDAKERNDAVGMVYSVFSMAEMNMLQYRLAEAEKYYRECIEIAAAVDFGNICYPLTNAHLFLFQSLTAQGKYDEALQAMPQTEAAVQRLEELEAQQNGYAGLGNRIILYTACTQYYLKMKDYRNAERYCTLAEELSRSIDATETTDYAILLSMRAQILEARGQYAQALKLAEQSCLLELAMGSIPTNLNDIMSVKARLLMRLGRVEESIALYDSIQTRTMDIFNTKYNAQLDEIRTIYEVDKLEHKNEIITIEKERHRINFLFALGGCILLLITLGIWIFYSRQIVLRNRELVRKNQQWANQQALEIIDKGKDTEIEKNMPAAEDYEIVEQAHRILLDGLFKEYELVLDTLAGKMGIHSKTLSQAINSVTGKNFNQFVNEYRIKEAIRIMSHEKDLRLKEIYWQTGFNSYSAFYRTFKQITGLHPTQFQNKDSETGGHILK
jgi:AraC-like DNA-binding protein